MEQHLSLVFEKYRFLLEEWSYLQQRQQDGVFLILVSKIPGLRQGRRHFQWFYEKGFYKAVTFLHKKEESQREFFLIQKQMCIRDRN